MTFSTQDMSPSTSLSKISDSPIAMDYISKVNKRKETAERMRRWRASNAEKNKDNDTRCRVYRVAKQKFGMDDSVEKQRWIQQEIAKRTEKRKLREMKKVHQQSSSFLLDHLSSSRSLSLSRTTSSSSQDSHISGPPTPQLSSKPGMEDRQSTWNIKYSYLANLKMVDVPASPKKYPSLEPQVTLDLNPYLRDVLDSFNKKGISYLN